MLRALMFRRGIGQVTGLAALAYLLALLAIAGCAIVAPPTPTPTPEPPPLPLSATASILDDNALIARIEGALDKPGSVYVEYWAEGAPRLRSRVERSDGESYTVYAVRLRAETAYSYQVFGAGSDGAAAGPTSAFTTGPLPDVLAAAKFDVLTGAPTHDITFLEFRQLGYMGLAAFDARGQVVWHYQARDEEQPYVMARRPNGNILFIAGYKGGTTAKAIVEIDPLGAEQARLVDECSPFGPIHHELEALDDGRVMYLSRQVSRPGFGDPPQPQEGDTIGIWDPSTGENRIVWSIFDFISPAERTAPDSNRTLPGNPLWGGCDRDRSVQDWSHADSLDVGPDGEVLVSLRNLDQVILLEPDLGAIRWRLGGPGGQFAFPEPSDRFYHAHDASLVGNGNVLLFDNGNHRPGNEGGEYSRALELELNMDAMTASNVWEYRLEPDMFAVCCSSATRLDNGNTLVMFGSNFAPECCRPFFIIEVDPLGEAVWAVEHTSPNKPNQYRVYPADSIMGERLVVSN